MVVDAPTTTTSSSSPPSTGYRKRPAVTRIDSGASGSSSRSSNSSASSCTSRFKQTLSSFDPLTTPPRHQSSGSAAWDQSTLTSPMRTLLLTMAPMTDGKSGSAAAAAAIFRNTRTEFYTWEALPPQGLMKACIAAFYGERGITSLICPVPECEAMEMLQSIYRTTHNSASLCTRQASRPNHRLCQVLLVAAAGSQCLETQVSNEVRVALFTSGKWYLDMAFGKGANDLERLRANMLVSLYLVFEKNITTKDFLNRAISIGQARGLHRQQFSQTPRTLAGEAAGVPIGSGAATNDAEVHDNWLYWKRIWQCLVFIDGWISASLGSVSQMCKTFEPIAEGSGRLSGAAENESNGSSADLDIDLHAELASLGVLMGAITKDVLGPDTVQMNTVRMYSDRLKAWHANLPSCLTLSTAVRESYESPRKNSTLLIHCAYLGSITQLTRRILIDTVTAQLTGSRSMRSGGSGSGGGGGRTLTDANATAEDFSKMCVSAARQLATVVGMLRAENRLTKRCWLVIQSAYTAAIVICLDVSRHRGRPMLESAFNENLDLISKCTKTLQHCATFDIVADGYLKILQPIYLTLSTPEPTSAAKRARLYRDPFTGPFGDPVSETYPSNEIMLDHILDLMKAPYGGEGTIIDQDFFSIGGSGGQVPEHYRFLYPPTGPSKLSTAATTANGSQQQPSHAYPHQHPHHLHASHRWVAPASPTSSRDVHMGNGGEHSPPKKYPYRTREEYEAFFRRVI